MTTELRNLTQGKLSAALQATVVPSDKDLAATPTAAAATKSYTLPLVCKYSGLTVGSLSVATVGGHMPLISHWKEQMVLHPVFSFQHAALLHFARNNWFRFCNFSSEEASDEVLTTKQEQILRVTALALLHKLANVRQDIAWMPEWQVVSSHWPSLMALSYWRAYLDSQRFNFPAIHLSKLEPEIDLKDYLQLCWSVKKDYEKRVNEKIEKEKLAALETATLAIRDELAGAIPSSKKQIWKWFVAHLPKRYSKDADTWMRELFFAEGEEIREFTLKDIDLFEEIFLCEVPTGSSISHAFSQMLDKKRKYLEQHIETFEILVPQSIIKEQEAGLISVSEPQYKDYPSKAQYLIAKAKWKLMQPAVQQRIRDAAAKQQTLTVKASHTPRLADFFKSEEEIEQERQETVELDAADEDVADRDDLENGEYES